MKPWICGVMPSNHGLTWGDLWFIAHLNGEGNYEIEYTFTGSDAKERAKSACELHNKRDCKEIEITL